MTWSAAEILALATKAARGAGAPPEQSARFGQAAVAHLRAGRDAAVLIAALDALPGGPVLILPRRIDMRLSGADGDRATIVKPEADPLLDSYVDALPFQTSECATPEGAVVTVQLGAPRDRLGPRRITGCAKLVGHMSELAKAILVPDSDISRRAGAGAGLTDND